MFIDKRKGVSPVIATVLLISIALILALIVFFWAKGFVGERAQKFDRAIEFACEDINFGAEAVKDEGDNGKIYIKNRGNVPIYAAEIKAKNLGSVKSVGSLDRTIAVGESDSFDFNLESLEYGEEIVVVPIILGESGTYKKAHVCDSKFGEVIEVD
jgi:flagellin-like protein